MVIVYQVFDNETDAIAFNGVPFASAALAQQRIDRTKLAWTDKGFHMDFPDLVVRESEVCDVDLVARDVPPPLVGEGDED
jgi:hypothetical protein